MTEIIGPNWRVSGSVAHMQHFYDSYGIALCGRKYKPPAPHPTDGGFVRLLQCGTCLAIRTRMLGGQGGRPEDMLNGDLTEDTGEGEG